MNYAVINGWITIGLVAVVSIVAIMFLRKIWLLLKKKLDDQ